jgi:hypothetical protein
MPAKHSQLCTRLVPFAACLAIAIPVSAVPILNGNFDSPIVPPDKDYSHFDTDYNQAPSDFGWTLISGTVELVNGSYWLGPTGAGDQSLDLNGNDSGQIAQNVFLPSGAYDLAFALSGNPDGGDEKELRVWLGTTSADFAFDSSGHTHAEMAWQIEHALFNIPTEGNYTLSFESLTRGPYGVAIDSITLDRVPETMGTLGTLWLGAFTVGAGIFLRRSR